jgi:S1-C subfamily serine protease
VALAAGLGVALALMLGGRVQASPGSTSAPVETGVVDVTNSLAFGQGTAAGTGIVLSRSGEVLTNNHVIRGAGGLRITDVGTGRNYAATVVGYSVAEDIAVLRLKAASGLKTARLGNSAAVRVGDHVTAVGNAGGVGGRPTVTSGKVTALHRSITVSDESTGEERLQDLIKSDASVQPGDSGGPLLNASGLVIGITTAASSSFQFRGTSSAGYAIPLKRALAIAKQVEAGRSSPTIHIGPTAFLGVLTRSNSDGGPGAGALVVDLVPGSAAAKAGLLPGDVITAFDGQNVSTPTQLARLVLRISPGSKVEVRWLDDLGTARRAVVRPAAGPPQ